MENRRRQLVVNRDFQRRYILGSVLAAIVIINLALAAAFLLADSWRDVLPQNLGFAIAVALAEFVVMLIVVWISLKASHRIAGPAHRLSQLLDELGGGNLAVQARLRDGDCLQEIADAFNAAVPRLRERVADIRSASAALHGEVQGNAGATESLRKLEAALAALDSGASEKT